MFQNIFISNKCCSLGLSITSEKKFHGFHTNIKRFYTITYFVLFILAIECAVKERGLRNKPRQEV